MVERQPSRGERVPPQDVEMEKSVLGAMLLDREAVTRVLEVIDDGSYFYKDAHRKIFEGIIGLFERNEPADAATLREELFKKKQLEEVGGEYYISLLVSDVASPANAAAYAKIVAEKAVYRKLIGVATEVIEESYDATDDALNVVDRAEQKIFSLAERRASRGFQHIEPLLKTTFDNIEAASARSGSLLGVASGFDKLDEMTAGFQPADLVILAGRPSMGKTALALNMARNAAVDHKQPIAIFSLEMASFQLTQRMLCSEARLDAHLVRTGRLADNQWQRLSLHVGSLSEAPIYIDDTPGVTVLDIRAKARRLKAEFDIQMLMIDYLQLINSHGRSESRQQEISVISRSLKMLAKELNIPVLALSQLSRAVEQRGGDGVPQLSDLRDSGAIEQDADVVMFVYRPVVYSKKEEDEGKGQIIVSKQRNGPIGSVDLSFIKEYSTFENLAREEWFEGEM